MRQLFFFCTTSFLSVFSTVAHAQQPAPLFTKPTPQISKSYEALPDAATEAQIREYLRISGTMDEFRKSWISALDKNRSLGEPYWPESFWTAIKHEMQDADLVPMYVRFLQEGVSRELMQSVLDAYRQLGQERFQGSPECLRMGSALTPLQGEWDKLKEAETNAVVQKVYAVYKPQIKAARARYLAEHPEATAK